MYGVSASYTRLLVGVLKAEGLDVDALCWEAGIAPEQLARPDVFVRRRAVYCLMRLAASRSGNPDIGLQVYRYFHPSSLQLLGYTMMCSASLRQALERIVRFSMLISDGCGVSLHEEAGECRLCIREYRESGERMPRSYADAGVAALLGFCRWLSVGQTVEPLALELPYAEPNDNSSLRQLFCCPLRFSADATNVLWRSDDLSRPLTTSNEALTALCDGVAEERLRQTYARSVTNRVRGVILNNLSGGTYDMESVAQVLCVSKRTLQRELELEGTQFKEVMSSARCNLAEFYLQHSSYSLKHIAYLLGFHDHSSFHKACVRWFGMPPGEYRESLLTPGRFQSGFAGGHEDCLA